MKKQPITKILLTMLISMIGANAFAYDIEVKNADGVTIYYNYINDGKELEVTNKIDKYFTCYSGNVVIPEEVTYMNRARKVTSIGSKAFNECDGLTSVTIPNSVTSIGNLAFFECYGLTSVTIPNSVTFIGVGAFSKCKSLTSVTIPNSVTSISDGAFSKCSSLTSVTIPNSVTSIGEKAFFECSGLTSVHISDIAAWCNIKFSDNPFSYAHHLYLNGEEVKDLVIPNGVISIGDYAFYYCTAMTSVTIPNSVTSIGSQAFYGIDMPTVISMIENPFGITGKSSSNRTFSQNTFNNATLYVPKGTIDQYKATDGWKDFLFIEEGNGLNGGGDATETKKCATPTISYQNGKLTFNSDTEGAICHSTITDDDINSFDGNEIQLGITYNISVYATKDGYDNSETATATLCWIDVEPKTEGITNAVANVRALPLLIQNNGSTLTVSGSDDGTPISVYSINGTEAGSAISRNGAATIPTTLQSGSAAIVKVGDKAIKVVMK